MTTNPSTPQPPAHPANQPEVAPAAPFLPFVDKLVCAVLQRHRLLHSEKPPMTPRAA